MIDSSFEVPCTHLVYFVVLFLLLIYIYFTGNWEEVDRLQISLSWLSTVHKLLLSK